MQLIRDEKTIPNFADGSLIYLDGSPYRILSHEKSEDDNIKIVFWLVELVIEKYSIIKTTLPQLQEGLANGRVCNCVDVEEYKYPVLKPGDKAITDLRYNCIKHFVDSLYPDYSALPRRGVQKDEMDNLAHGCNLSTKNVRRYLLRYIQSGGTYWSVVDRRLTRAMEPEHVLSGGNVRGKKRNGVDNEVLNDARLIAIYEETYDKYIRTLNKYQYDSNTKYKPTLKSAYRSMITKYFSGTDENGNFTILPENQRPSYERFYSWVRAYKLHGAKISAYAKSYRDRRNNNRLLVGSSDYGVYNLMEMVEIDENETSVMLLSANPNSPNQVIGHGITYIAIDVLSHRIVGASVGLTNNSYEGFLNLMDSMMLTDAENAAVFGVQFDSNSPVFPGQRLPQEIRVDHGAEYTSTAITENLTGGKGTTSLDGLPIAINLAPVAIGSLKGVVESFFGELHRCIQNALESSNGYVTGTYDSKHVQEAVLTITELREIVYEVIKMHNNTPVVDYPLTPDMASRMEIVTPNMLWDYFADTRIGGFDVSNDQLRVVARYGLMKRDKTFKLSKKQISYDDVLYWDIGDDENLMYEAIQLEDSSKPIEMRYDPRSVNCLYRLAPKTATVHRYFLSAKRPAMKDYRNLRWADAEPGIIAMRKNRYKAIAQKNEGIMLTEMRIATIADTKSGSEKNIVENRKEALRMENAALTAFDIHRKDQCFYGDASVQTEPDLEEVVATTAPLIEINNNEIIPEIDLNDIGSIAKLYGL